MDETLHKEGATSYEHLIGDCTDCSSHKSFVLEGEALRDHGVALLKEHYNHGVDRFSPTDERKSLQISAAVPRRGMKRNSGASNNIEE